MSKIIYEQDDGTVAIIIPNLKEINPKTGVEYTIDEIAMKDVPSGLSYDIVEDSAIPTDRSFRNAWIQSGKTVVEDMPKAKEIHKTNIRLARTEKFKELDVDYQKATETSADTSDIVAKKQALRDAPAASGITTAVTTTELKQQWDTNILGTSPYS